MSYPQSGYIGGSDDLSNARQQAAASAAAAQQDGMKNKDNEL